MIITAIHFVTLLIRRYNEDCFHSSRISFLFHAELIHFDTENGLWAGRSEVRIWAKVIDLSLSKSSSPALGLDDEPVSTAKVKKAEDYTPIIPMCLHGFHSENFTFNLYGSQNLLSYILMGSILPKFYQYLATDIFSFFQYDSEALSRYTIVSFIHLKSLITQCTFNI